MLAERDQETTPGNGSRGGGACAGERAPAAAPEGVRRIRILHVVHGLARGGLENGVVNLLNSLPPAEFEQAVCCLERSGEMAERIRVPTPVHELHRGRYDLRTPARLAALIRAWRPDVVHARNWTAWLDAFTGHLLAGRPATLVWSFHGFAEGEDFPWRRRLASRLLARGTDRLLAVCHDSAHRYAAAAGIAEDRFAMIYNGVDCERFRPAADRAALRRELGIPDAAVVATTVASLTPVKDHFALVRAAARIDAPYPLRFLLVGDGPERPALEAEIGRLGAGGCVTLVGTSDRVPEYLAASDLYVLPSRLEGMSNSILEAMAAGLPVIANRVGGNPELVEHGATGLLCRQGDTADLAAAITTLAGDRGLRERMGTAARQRAERVFSIRAMTDAYAAWYRRVAGGEVAPRPADRPPRHDPAG